MVAGPDAELLSCCAKLVGLQAEWQRLWILTPDTQDAGSENLAFDAYAADVWPGCWISPGHSDAAARLKILRATTLEGLIVKAAAVLAIVDASTYGDGRDDEYEFLVSVLRDAAGSARIPLGDGAYTPCCASGRSSGTGREFPVIKRPSGVVPPRSA